MATARRTLVKSQPELWELVDQPERMQGLMSALLGGAAEIEVTAREPEDRLAWQGAVEDEAGSILIEMEKRGFGTRVAIEAKAGARGEVIDDWLEAVFDELSAPDRRPFRGIV
jgi:hypothetical protein